MLKDFKKFALRGNVIDMAIGFTVGAAFATIAKSLVEDVIMPPIGLVTGNVDFADQFWLLKAGTETPPPYATLADAQGAGAVTINYGVFLNNVIAFLIIALVVYFVVRAVNRLEDRMEAHFGADAPKPEEPSDKKCRYCLSTIPYRARRCAYCTSDLEEAAEGV